MINVSIEDSARSFSFHGKIGKYTPEVMSMLGLSGIWKKDMWKRDQINDQRHSMAMPKDEMRTSIKNPLSNLGRIYYHVSRKTRGTPSVSGSIITAKQEGLRPLIRKQEIVSGLQTHSTILLTRTKKRSKNQKIKISYHV